MNTKKGLFLGLVILLSLSAASFARADTTDTRYLVQSNSELWKKSFNARNIFDGGFTADLSVWQLKLAQIFGISVEPVKTLTILATPVPTPVPTPQPTPTSNTPTDQIPWGVRFIYGASLSPTDVPSGGDGVRVAILDTGADITHPDLINQVVDCADFTGPQPLIKDTCTDNNGHGTHVAGIVAADGGADGAGIYGIAPDAQLLIYKVCSDDGTCYSDDVAAGIRYATDQGANVILISIGSDSDSSLVDDAINYAQSKDALVIAAAGNDGPDSAGIDYPASLENVISVGAIDDTITVPDWSSRGNNDNSQPYIRENGDIDFVAPGVNVESTDSTGGYMVLSGTSMAAAHIAGLAAKEWQTSAKDPALETDILLHNLANDVSPDGDDSASGWGTPRL